MRIASVVLVFLIASCSPLNFRNIESIEQDKYFNYSLVFLSAGMNANELDSMVVEAAALGHRSFIERKGKDGTLLLAAPFGEPRGNAHWRGIYVFDLANVDSAYEITGADPSISAGLFTMHIMPWRVDTNLRPLRDKLEQSKQTGMPFKPASYALAIGEPTISVEAARKTMLGKQQLICAGELGGEGEGQVVLLLNAKTVEEARIWLELANPLVSWDISSLWASDLLGELASDR